MKPLLLVFSLWGPSLPTWVQNNDMVRKELQSLQGTWTLVEFENDRQCFNRRGIAKEFEKGAPLLLLHIEGDKVRLGEGDKALSFTLRKDGKPRTKTYHVQPGVVTARFDLSTGSEGGLFGGVITFAGIYRHTGDRLEICAVWADRAELPTDFTMKRGVEWRWLLVYERLKK